MYSHTTLGARLPAFPLDWLHMMKGVGSVRTRSHEGRARLFTGSSTSADLRLTRKRRKAVRINWSSSLPSRLVSKEEKVSRAFRLSFKPSLMNEETHTLFLLQHFSALFHMSHFVNARLAGLGGMVDDGPATSTDTCACACASGSIIRKSTLHHGLQWR